MLFRSTTKQDKTAPKFPDRLKRDFTAPEANVKWCGDILCRRRHNMSYADVRIMPMRPQECLLMKRFTLEMSA